MLMPKKMLLALAALILIGCGALWAAEDADKKSWELNFGLALSTGDLITGFDPSLTPFVEFSWAYTDWGSLRVGNEDEWAFTTGALYGKAYLGLFFFDIIGLQLDFLYPDPIALQLTPSLEYDFILGESDEIDVACEGYFLLTGAFAFTGFEPSVTYQHSFGSLSLSAQICVPYDVASDQWGFVPIVIVSYSF
jgi:hypothetical protein